MRTKSDFPKLTGKAILSPMAGVTDVAFRTLCKRYGAAMTCTEFVSSAALVRESARTYDMLTTDPCEKPVAVQLFGSSETEIVDAAQRVEKNFDVIDINCGCPAWKVIKTGAGSALLNDPQKVARFVNKIVSAVTKPVTVKIRTGIDDKHLNAVAVAKAAQDAGASAIAIHGRTQKQGYSGEANWEHIRQVKEALDIPVIGNGDVFSAQTFAQRLEESGVDAILLARGVMGNPALFTQINTYLKTGEVCALPTAREQFFAYLILAKKYHLGMHYIKPHAITFTKGTPGGARLREKLGNAKSVEEIEQILAEKYE